MASTSNDTATFTRTEKKEDAPHWQENVEKVLQPRTREMLETYAKVPPRDVVAHIKDAQDRSWKLAPFASVGGLTWLNPYIRLHMAYDTILSRIKSGSSILDCACMIAPDLRELAYSGAPTDKMYGFDIEPGFFEIGYDFYKDRETFQGQFFAADAMIDLSESNLAPLIGQIDIIWCAKFIHLFDRQNQPIRAAKLISLLKPQPGSMFVGSQNGFPGSKDVLLGQGSPKFASMTDRFYLGDENSIKEIWDEVAEMTGTKWQVESRLLDMRTIGLHEDDGSPYKKVTGYNLQWTAVML